MKSFALFVAVNAPMGHPKPLRYAEADARRMRRFFASALGRVRPECTDAILGRRATRSQVLRYLAALARLPIENLIIYWCGHGGDVGIQLYDGILTYEEIRLALQAIPSRTKVLLLNTCRAGAARAVLGGREFGSIDEALSVAQLASCPGVRILAAVSQTESAHEDHHVRGSRFTCALLYALTHADGDLVVGRVPFISDERAFERASEFVATFWPNEPLPELYGPIGERAAYPLAVAQPGFIVGEASIRACDPTPGPGLKMTIDVRKRRYVRTLLRWQVSDKFGRWVGDGRAHMDPKSMATRFTPALACDARHLRSDPFMGWEIEMGYGVGLTWTLQVLDGHDQVLDEAVVTARYASVRTSPHFGV